jgi:hypothetical protein
MKTLLKITILITAYLMLLFSTASCFFDGVKGSNNVVSEERAIISNFETIKVHQGISVYLSQGNKTELRVEADDNIIDLLITEVKDNELNIYFEKNVYKAKARNVYLTTSEISKIITSSGAMVKSDSSIQTPTITAEASSGSSIKIDVNTNEVISESSSGAIINLSGNTTSLTVNSNSGSSINASKLACQNATASANSGARISLNVNEELTANANSGGSISFDGNPTQINKSTSSGGSVSKN